VVKSDFGALKVLDVGCGDGESIPHFYKKNQKTEWYGIDVEDYFNYQRNIKSSFQIYNGTNIPFADNFFDVVYSKQVFEHVRYPGLLLKDILRVLKPGGVFIGSTSQLEQYHSLSLWNYTPLGFLQLIEEAGLTLAEIRPSVDGFFLLKRSILNKPRYLDRYWTKETFINRTLSFIGWLRKRNHRSINFMKFYYCDSFVLW